MNRPAEMEALVFRHDQLRYLASRAGYAVGRRFWSARLPPLSLVKVPRPTPSRAGWCRLDVSLSGICGSDLAMLTGSESLYLEPEASYPFVPGHELTGIIAEVSPGRTEPAPGSRVAVWPVLGCNARGTKPVCPACREGWTGLCAQREGGWPGPGLAIGFNRDTGGGWSSSCLAHEGQLWPVPNGVTDQEAVLLDPAASSLAALLRTEHTGIERTLIIGGGTIGLLAACLHRALNLAGQVECLVRHRFQQAWLARHGVPSTVVRDEQTFRDWAADRGMRARRVSGYGYVFRGTQNRVVVAAGTRSAVRWSLQSVHPRGTIALMTAPAGSRLDLTPLWYREVSIHGVYAYGPVPWQGEQCHPYDVLLPRLADGQLQFAGLVTHIFSLGRYLEALDLAVRRRETGGGVIKVALRPGPV